MSLNAHDSLKGFPQFITEPRGDVCVKVKNYPDLNFCCTFLVV